MKSDYTTEEFMIAKEDVLNLQYSKFESNPHPRAELVCGQPGAGKSFLISHLDKGDIAFVNGDEFRAYHPHGEEILKETPEDYIELTRPFNGRMTEEIINDLSDKKINMIIEGTLRQYETQTKTKNLLESKGYDVGLNILAVPPQISYLRVHKRYHEMKERGSVPRKTGTQFHDHAVNQLIKNFALICERKDFKRVRIFEHADNSAVCIYSSDRDHDKNPVEVLKKAVFRKFTVHEVEKIKEKYMPYVPSEKIDELFSKSIQEKRPMVKGIRHKVNTTQKGRT